MHAFSGRNGCIVLNVDIGSNPLTTNCRNITLVTGFIET